MSDDQEKVRRGLWFRHLLENADKTAPLDAAAINAAIPPEPDAWPDGIDPFAVAAPASPDDFNVATSTLGKALAAMQPLTMKGENNER